MAKNSQFSSKKNQIINIFGYHAVKAAIKNSDRIKKRLILSQNSSTSYLQEFEKKISKISIIPKKEFDKKYSKEENNQGIILEAYYFPEKSFNSIIDKLKKNTFSVLLILDQINDPQNIGSIMRSSALFNCKSIITTSRHSPDMNSTIVKSASGAAELVNLIKVPNLVRCIEELKKNNFWIIGLDGDAKKSIHKFEMPNRCVFVLGSEHTGLRKLTKENCDEIVSITSKNINAYGIDSLNVSNAATIALYEYFKSTL
tara:strand:+ start:55 stop:825 length:771 start_codon:yes stop_codon:yes gene_type:complete